MNTVRRLIYKEVASAIALVALGFLALFFFFDLVDELQDIGKSLGIAGVAAAEQSYQLRHALLYVALLIPNHLYELLPISVLIGTIFVMARLAQSSEYTILRTSGLGPWRALQLLLTIGGVFVLLSFLVGDYLAPPSSRAAQLVKAKFRGDLTVGQTGAWLKEKQRYNAYVANVKTLSPDNTMSNVKIYEFDNKGLITSITQAGSATFKPDDSWLLSNVTRDDFLIASAAGSSAPTAATSETSSIKRSTLATLRWPTELTEEMVSVALLKPERMGTVDLFNYVRHLDNNGQTAQRYEIEFWRKVFYPLSCLVMVILALPFAYLHFRAGGISAYVFAGVMIGISFFLLNNVFGYIGNLRDWKPWIAAATPGLLYALASLGAFGWLVLRR